MQYNKARKVSSAFHEDGLSFNLSASSENWVGSSASAHGRVAPLRSWLVLRVL